MSTLWAVSDLHVAVAANAPKLDELRPPDPNDWLIVAGDVAEDMELVLSTLASLRQRYAQVIWVPGNHELFARRNDPLTGPAKYEALVEGCRAIGVNTPQDPYLRFHNLTICPLFSLYDYSFRDRALSIDEALNGARQRGIVLTDEFTIAPHVDIRSWCWQRLAYSVKRLAAVDGPTVLVNHWPLVIEPTLRLRFHDIALWSGTRHTRDWPTRFHAHSVIYGHLHIPSITRVDGVDHIDVSLGYPREWQFHHNRARALPWPYPVAERP